MAALTNSGDATTFTSAASLWSGKSGYTPVVRPNGLLTGGAVIPAVSTTAQLVDVAALTCNLQGVITTVAADTDVAVTRPASGKANICSITVTDAGAIAVVVGTDSASTALVETRAAAGGPPLIPVGSIEIAQVRMITSASAAVTAAEIFSVVGTHVEMANYPLFNIDYTTGSVEFISALPTIHTGVVPKKVYASYKSPIFSEISLASDFTPPETTNSVSSTQIYGTTLGSTSQTLGQGGFTAYLEDGVSDALVAQKNATLWFRFYPDRYKTPYLLTQGKLGVSRTFPAGDSIQAACTISATTAAKEVTT
jgi:hypothetical protein